MTTSEWEMFKQVLARSIERDGDSPVTKADLLVLCHLTDKAKIETEKIMKISEQLQEG